MKTVAYLRVSTPQQDVRSQRLAILEYARKHDFLRIDDFIEATASGQASEKRRRKRGQLLDRIDAGTLAGLRDRALLSVTRPSTPTSRPPGSSPAGGAVSERGTERAAI